jgi:hypothetical protein
MSCCGGLKPLGNTPAVISSGVLDIILAANIIAGWDAAVTTNDGSNVSAMLDVSGNGFALTQAVAGNRPTIVPAGGPNANPSVLFDGMGDTLINAILDLPAPGTTPTFYWGVLRQVTFTGGESLWAAGVAPTFLALLQIGGFAIISQNNGANVNGNAGMTLNSYKRLEAYFSNTVGDYIKGGSVTSTGASAGNNDAAAGFALGANAVGAGSTNIEVCELWIFNTLPTALQLAQLEVYAANRYGASVLT